MSIRVDDPVLTMLAALIAALALSLVKHGFRWGCRVVRRAKRRIAQIDRILPVTLEVSLTLRIQPGNPIRHRRKPH